MQPAAHVCSRAANLAVHLQFMPTRARDIIATTDLARARVLTTPTERSQSPTAGLAAAARASQPYHYCPSWCAPGMLSVGRSYRKAAALPPSYDHPWGTPSIIVPIAGARVARFGTDFNSISHSHHQRTAARSHGRRRLRLYMCTHVHVHGYPRYIEIDCPSQNNRQSMGPHKRFRV